jgi:hypothetical protein
MKQKLIENMARAICVNRGKNPDADQFKVKVNWPTIQYPEDTRNYRLYISDAIVAYNAIEPYLEKVNEKQI